MAYDVLEEQRDFDRAELAELWPPAPIPVLRDGDEVVGETSIIIEHVAGARLVPSLEARKWDRLCDQHISNSVQAIVLDTIEQRFDGRAVNQARSRLDMVYGMLETQLTQYEFLAGDSFTIADCAAAPGAFLCISDPPLGRGQAAAADALLPNAGATAVLRQGDRGRPALPRPVPAVLASRLRPSPLASPAGYERRPRRCRALPAFATKAAQCGSATSSTSPCKCGAQSRSPLPLSPPSVGLFARAEHSRSPFAHLSPLPRRLGSPTASRFERNFRGARRHLRAAKRR